MSLTLQQITEEVRRMDPHCTGDAYKAAVCLFSSLVVGPDSKKLIEFTGYPSKLVRGFSSNLRASGVWSNGLVHADWFNKDSGGVAFWCDVAVAQGLMRRVPRKRGRPRRRLARPEEVRK